MSMELYESCYGLEDARTDGERITPCVVGSTTLGIPQLCEYVRREAATAPSAITVQFVMQVLQVSSVVQLSRVPLQEVLRFVPALEAVGVPAAQMRAIHAGAVSMVSARSE